LRNIKFANTRSADHERISAIIAPLIPYLAVAFGLLLLHNAWIAILAYHAGIIAVVLASPAKFNPSRLFQSNNWKIPAVTAAIGVAGGILVYLLLPLIGTSPDLDQYLLKIGLTHTTWPFFILYFFLVNPFLEEHYWRGFLGSDSKRITLNDLLFAGYHILVLTSIFSVSWLVVTFLALVLDAWVWRQADRLSQGLLPSTVSHISADLSVMMAVAIIVR
jgi:membrane protease YdiL (CAAX protease family)